MTPKSPAVIELDDVAKHYESSPPVRALDGVSMRVDKGELVSIAGPSGSGKSTLMNIMGTLDRPTRGQVSIEQISIGDMSDSALTGIRAARLGFIFQQFHLLETESVLDNVANGLLYRGVRLSIRRKQAASTLERVGLATRMNHRPPQLSGGERQRVAIARALVGDPAVVFADEPTGNLDTKTSADIVKLLMRLNSEGSTIIIITHDREIANLMPRQITISDGKIVADKRTS